VENAPVYYMKSKEPDYFRAYQKIDSIQYQSQDLNETLLKLLKDPSIASKEWVYRQYDYMVRTSTAVKPGSDAAVISIRGTNKALAMTTDGNGRYIYLDPYVGGKIAVAEAARNIVASGAEPLAITDGINFGNPEKPEVFWQFERAVDGMSEACNVLGTPVIGGNVSFYNETNGSPIYPTPIVGMVGLVHDLQHITTQDFKDEGDCILLLGETNDQLTGSEFQRIILGKTEGKPPIIDLEQEKLVQKVVLKAIQAGYIKSAHDLSDGGLAVALAESSISGNIGADILIKGSLSPESLLFSESQSRFIVSVSKENLSQLKRLIEDKGIPFLEIGTVRGESLKINYQGNDVIDLSLSEISKAWKDAIPCLMKK